MKGIIIVCEGTSDVAYLSFLLKSIGYDNYKIVIEKMIKPLKEFFISQFQQYEYKSNELLKRPILPWIMKKKESQTETYVLLYSIDGLFKIDNIKQVIKSFFYQGNENETFGNDQTPFFDSTFALTFFVDADDKGILERTEYIKEKFIDIFPEIINLKHNIEGIVRTDKKPFKNISCYILTDNNNKFGNLEDILIPIMAKGKSEKLFKDAEKYLDENNFVRFKEQSKEINENKTKSDFKKSKIGIAGQLECSGNDNTEIILNSGFLDGKIDTDSKSQDIIKLLSKIRSEIKKV